MNKDFDERLVPNGEYRHAENIQVSTSEGSAVGTVQNILGNSLVSGQDFIGTNSTCIGSVADEANDKVYYFITAQQSLNDSSLVDSTEWNSSPIINEDYSGEGVLLTSSIDSSASQFPVFESTSFDLVDGKTYELDVEFSDLDDGGSTDNTKFYMESATGAPNTYRPYYNETVTSVKILINGKYKNVFTFNESLNNNSTQMRFRVELTGGNNFAKTVRLKSISLKEKGNSIIQHDTRLNSITPVLVDHEDVLKFQTNSIVTGINIIDGMLFWTDNNSEPKKINIQRCIDGTDTNGITHTSFLNPKTGTSIPIEEKHITVIKKAPSIAPKIELVSERNEAYTYTGVMRITEPTTPSNNTSSFNNYGATSNQAEYDFSTFKIGDEFRTAIETDIEGNSGFTLQWQPGDTVVFKEFDQNGEPPSLPITNYSIKAIIQPVFYPSSVGPGPNFFTDTQDEKAENGDFIYPNTNGTKPLNYGWDTGIALYDNANDKIIVNTSNYSSSSGTSGNYKKIWFANNCNWETGADSLYRITVKLSNVSASNTDGLRVYFVVANTNANQNAYYWYSDLIDSNGTFTQDIVLDVNSAYIQSNYGSYAGRFFIQNTGAVDFEGDIDFVSIVNLNEQNARVRFKITDIVGTPPTVETGDGELKYAVDRLDTQEKLYQFKLPRFATRYRYQDGEYSAFSPFTQVAFLPGGFDYHPKKGYNLGMTNLTTSVVLHPDTDIHPDDAVFIDILYKEDNSTNVYVLDSIRSDKWNNPYTITSEAVNRSVPSNQLIRPWDNVPKKALAQDVTGNRIIYANYEQGYDLINQNNDVYYPKITTSVEQKLIQSRTKPSVKSARDYQVGIAFVDKYGRETPVIASQDSSTKSGIKIENELADKQNKIKVKLDSSDFMKDTEFFKFFVKETSGEYYNLAMDRFWQAEDDHVWVSFASSDVNKVSLDDFLILKKGADVDYQVKEPARYKVIAIENEAPDYIKTKRALIESKEHSFATNNIFGDVLIATSPLSGRDAIELTYGPFLNSAGANIDLIDDGSVFYIEFSSAAGTSKRYRINKIDTNWRHQTVNPTDASYFLKLDKKLGDDVDFITDGTKILDGTIVNIYKYKAENSPEFDGRFFVKLLKDVVFVKNVMDNVNTSVDYRVFASKKLYYLKSDIATTHAGSITGQTDGMYGPDGGDFGRYAAFFRNYRHDTDDANSKIDFRNGSTTTVSTDAGQYRFGVNSHWENEFLDYTSSGQNGSTDGWVGSWDYTQNNRSITKIADKYPNQDPNEEEVWFVDAGEFSGSRTSNESLHWPWIGQADGTMQGITNQSGGNAQATLRIGIGGLFHDEVSTSSNDSISDFFAIGVDGGGNPYYNDPDTVGLVSQFNTGKIFRFKEDPSQTIYTIQTNTVSRLLRHHDGTTAVITPGSSADGPYDNDNDQIAQLSPNLTKTWNLNIKNEDGDGDMNWDPTGALGPISSDGLKLTIAHHSIAGSATFGSSCSVRVETLLADHTDGTKHQIKKGMILESHSNGSHTYDDSGANKYLVVWKIEKVSSTNFLIHLTGYVDLLESNHVIFTTQPTVGQNMVFRQAVMNGYSSFSTNRINAQSPNFSIANPGLYAVSHTIEFLEAVEGDSELPTNPAIWETEPKENTPLDVYYEASGLNPIELKEDNLHLVVPPNSLVEHVANPNSTTSRTTILSSGLVPFSSTQQANNSQTGFYIDIIATPAGVALAPSLPRVGTPNIVQGSTLKITRPDGSAITVIVDGYVTVLGSSTIANRIFIKKDLYVSNTEYTLGWHNCFSFGNGVESNRIKDGFNLPFITNGARVSTVLEEEEDYKQERRKYGLIYSGIYNGVGNVNNLNQFIAGEKITKELNPIYGSIQKIHSRDSDLIALCEDKVLQIYANKDALFNADGNVNVTATNKVLGQSRPFVGEYGISTNPESFVSESYRVYFADKTRGAVLRLSKDGLTPISDAGMKDYFKDNLKNNDKIIGSYDDRKDEYNITLPTKELGRSGNLLAGSLSWVLSGGSGTQWTINNGVFQAGQGTDWGYAKADVPEIIEGNVYELKYTITVGGAGQFILANHSDGGGNVNLKETLGDHSVIWTQGSSNVGKISLYNNNIFDGTVENISVTDITNLTIGTTVSFKENVRGWVSFKSFVPENGISCSNDYYTFKNGKIHKHHDESVDRNTFYGEDLKPSVLEVVLNDSPDVIKSFNTLNYSGEKDWSVSKVYTNKQEGSISEFIEKEGRWSNYIKGIDADLDSNSDFGALNVQGIGKVKSIDANSNIIKFNGSINSSVQVGDVLYYENNGVQKISDVVNVSDKQLEVSSIGSVSVDDFVLFAKNNVANVSSLLGHYASAIFENNSTSKTEIFSVGSEVTESSK